VTPEEISARKILGLIMPSSWWFRRNRNITSIGLFYKKVEILLGGCLTVKNLWGDSVEFSTTVSSA